MSRIAGKLLHAACPILMLCTLTLLGNLYGEYSGIPPEFPVVNAGSFPAPMVPHGNLSERPPRPNIPNSTALTSLNLVSWWDWIFDLIPPGLVFRVIYEDA